MNLLSFLPVICQQRIFQSNHKLNTEKKFKIIVVVTVLLYYPRATDDIIFLIKSNKGLWWKLQKKPVIRFF